MPVDFRVCRSLEEAGPDFGPCVLTIGNFDGVHLGHREILRRLVSQSEERGWTPSALTFDPHPATIVAPERVPPLLSTLRQRCQWMRDEGLAQVLILPFTPEFSALEPEDFVREILVEKLRAKVVLVGANFRFGRAHAGDTKTLEELGRALGFETEIVPAVTVRGRLISSSEIRRLIREGRVAAAARLLGRAYCLEGDVVSGAGLGSKATVPTLNLRPEQEVLPASGVYVSRSWDMADDRSWSSVTNVGRRPTFNGVELTVETYLLDKFEEPSPRRLRVQLLWRLREERKYPSAEALKQQIQNDVKRTGDYFRRRDYWMRPRTSARS